MKNTFKLFGIIVLTAVIGFAAAGCVSPNGPEEPPVPDATWTLSRKDGAAPDGGGAATADTTAIIITFNKAVSLVDADITIEGVASRNDGEALSSSGGNTVWEVPVTVTASDIASVTLNKTGVKKEKQEVMVYKSGSVPAINFEVSANGTAGGTDTSAITLSFEDAVSGLQAEDITLTPGTGVATKGALTPGSGNSYSLAVTVVAQGTITVKVDKDGVTAIEKEVTVHKKPVNPVSGKTTYIEDGKIEFSTAVGNSGTFTVYSNYGDGSSGPVQGGEQYTWEKSAEGNYTWNQGAQTITATVTKIADEDGNMVAKSEVENMIRPMVQAQLDETIEEIIADTGISQAEAEAAMLEVINEMMGANYPTLTAALNAYISLTVDEYFAPKTYTYTFSNDGVSLILLEALPAPSGTDELAGKTFYGQTWSWDPITEENHQEKDEDHTYVFSSGTARTFTESQSWGYGGSSVTTGSYSYNSTQKRVYFKPATIDGQTPADYYASVYYDAQYNNYPTEADYRTAQTVQRFATDYWQYDLSEMIIGWF